MHGDEGAKIGYGRLYYRSDAIQIIGGGIEIEWEYTLSSSSLAHFALSLPDPHDSTYAEQIHTCHQSAISGLTATTPRIGSPTGDTMDSEVPNVYHQLEGYGDVYLYFSLDIAATNPVYNVYVKVGLNDPDDAQEVGAVDQGFVSHTLNDGDTGDGDYDPTGVYRVKLGTVNEGESIKQSVTTDVFYSALLFTRGTADQTVEQPPPVFGIGWENDEDPPEQQNNNTQFGYFVQKPSNANVDLGFVDTYYEVKWTQTHGASVAKSHQFVTGAPSSAAVTETYTVARSAEYDPDLDPPVAPPEELTVSDVCWRAWPTDPFRKVSGTVMKITLPS